MKKIAVLFSSLALTLSALNSTHAMSFSIGSGGSLVFDGVNLAIGRHPVEVLKSDTDLADDDALGAIDLFNPSSNIIGNDLGPVSSSLLWTEPDSTSRLFESGKYLGRPFGNYTFWKMTLGEPMHPEFEKGGMLSLSLFDATGITRDILSGHGSSAGNRHPVPEPAIMILVGTGLLGLAGYGKKFKKHKYRQNQS